ncbi:hypothetical protein [Ligilactobacillus ruminis]|nr:hypothetical protein [Ligilactobacillus ruminis]MDB7637790.1 hypothetical protein [Ligilactobacillus ruminis]MDB7680923.1 hypothetical protein [Ligilactobacillus ruminis]
MVKTTGISPFMLNENLHTRSIILGFVSAVYGAASITGPLVGGLIVDSFS